MKPQIIMQDTAGIHNLSDTTVERLKAARSYEDLSTICIIPTRGTISAKVVQSWLTMMTPMNQKFMRMFVIGMPVDEAYNSAIEAVLAHPDLSQWKYIMTLEEDNVPAPDSLIKLYEGMKDFDVIGGLYWTKGEAGQPMIYGDPQAMPLNFIPQIPKQEVIQEANGLGMGFNLFKLDIFKNKDIPKPWFKTLQEVTPEGAQAYSQDLYFYQNLKKWGYRVACDTRVKIGHYDIINDIIW